MDAVGKIGSKKKMFIVFDQMKDEPTRAKALFNIPQVVHLVLVHVIWRQANPVIAPLKGRFDLQSLVWEGKLSNSVAFYHPT